MGIFSKFINGQSSSQAFSKEEALLGIIVATSAADGEISNEEIVELKSIVIKSRTLEKLGDREFRRIIDKVFKVLKREGVDKLIQLSKRGLPKEMYEGVFILLCDIAFADGFIDKAEETLLTNIQQSFMIGNERAAMIFEVISKKRQV